MEYLLIGVGLVIVAFVAAFIHRRVNAVPPQAHSGVKTPQDHDPMEVAKATFIGIPPSR